jgi:FdhE protein
VDAGLETWPIVQGGGNSIKSTIYEPSAEAASVRISEALDLFQRGFYPLKNILKAFGEIFLEQARLKAELPRFTDLPVPPPDRLRFEQGVPLTSEEVILQIPENLWKTAADRLIPTMELCFPKIFNELAIIGQAFAGRHLNSERCLKVLARGLGGEAEATAADLGVSSRSLQFILSQIVKPLVARKAEVLRALIDGLGWHKGYCPVCGSMPELSFTKQEEGQRWLRCSLCSHSWRFARFSCPFCENEDQGKLSIYYIDGRKEERAEVCEKCGRYVVGIDLRGQLDESVLEVAAIGMVHLDMLAQQKGLLPAAACAWNVVSSEEISSSPVRLGSRGLNS